MGGGLRTPPQPSILSGGPGAQGGTAGPQLAAYLPIPPPRPRYWAQPSSLGPPSRRTPALILSHAHPPAGLRRRIERGGGFTFERRSGRRLGGTSQPKRTN